MNGRWTGGGAEAPRGLKSALRDGAGAGGDVAVFRAFELLPGFPGRCDGGGVDVRVLEEDFHDGVVVNGPDFEICGHVGEVAGFDEVDFVRSIFMIAAGAGVGGVSLIGQESVTVGGLIWYFCLSDLTLAHRYKRVDGVLRQVPVNAGHSVSHFPLPRSLRGNR